MKKIQILLFALAFTVILPASGPAAGEIKLTADVQARLMALEPLRGNGINGTAFDGRPVLVTFFASW